MQRFTPSYNVVFTEAMFLLGTGYDFLSTNCNETFM